MQSFKEISKCQGYKSLKADVMRDIRKTKAGYEKGWGTDRGIKLYTGSGKNEHSKKFKWIIDRAKHYSYVTGVPVSTILNSWENDRSYWYHNYYQNCNQPKINGKDVVIVEDLLEAKELAALGFRCPYCKGVSKDPFDCTSGIIMENIKAEEKRKVPCNWASYGLFGTLGEGIYLFRKDIALGKNIFMPIAIEKERASHDAIRS